MTRNNRIILFSVIGGVLLIGIILLITLGSAGSNSKKYDWFISFNPESRQPYGTKFIKEMLKSYKDGDFFVLNSSFNQDLLDVENMNSSYIYIGNEFYADSASVDKLLEYVGNGNHVFISAKSVPQYLMYELILCTTDSEEKDDWDKYYYDPMYSFGESTYWWKDITVNFSDEKLHTKNATTFNYVIKNKEQDRYWTYFTEDYDCYYSDEISTLGYINETDYMINYFTVEYGNGYFFFHTNPLVFTNYHLRNEAGYEYASRVFSYLNNEDIYWDEMSDQWHKSSNGEAENDILSIFLKFDGMRYAWYGLIIMAILFLLFQAKRQQRVIPVNYPKENTSLEFAKLVSQLSYEQRNDVFICKQKIRSFLAFVRNRYNLILNLSDEDNTSLNRLAAKSGIEFEVIEKIAAVYHKIKGLDNKSSMTDFELMNFYRKIDHFYKNCK